MTAQQLRQQFLEFFESKSHAIIPSAPLVPENDPTTLFITAGMHPLVPYLLGQDHPKGKRLTSVQKCVRTTDIDEVGDTTHFTFFEMLGNWSLGDYFKKEAINWSWEFLTSPDYLNLDPEKLFVTVFAGDDDAPRDEEAASIWQEVFSKTKVSHAQDRIFYYPKKENWWGPAGQTGPCGPSTEIFYYTGSKDPFATDFKDEPSADNSDFIEIWNNVFMKYNKQADGSFPPLEQHNVDTGLGLERMLAILSWIKGDIQKPDPYLSPLLNPTITKLEQLTGNSYSGDTASSLRLITDHLRSAVFMIMDGVVPSNKEQGYVLRRLIRMAVRELRLLGIAKTQLQGAMVDTLPTILSNEEYLSAYPELTGNATQIVTTITDEVAKFTRTLDKGLKKAQEYDLLNAQVAFDLYQTYGFPFEMTAQLATERGQKIDKTKFYQELEEHQQLSRQQSGQGFKGGLADHSEAAKRYHTATHLLHAALRKVLGEHVHQAGSNITAKRLRFDFTHEKALTSQELTAVQKWINDQIKANLPVTCQKMNKQTALNSGALAFFEEKYPDEVTVYTIGNDSNWISKELCGGPHVENTAEIGPIEIFKQKSSSAGVRRVYLRFAKN